MVSNSNAAKEDSIDQVSFQNTFKSVGLPPTIIPIQKLKNTIIPKNSLLLYLMVQL